MKVKIFDKIYEVEHTFYCEEEKGTYYYLKGKKTPYCDLDYDIEIISDSEELTPLGALNNIKNLFIGSSINPEQQFEIIENALKHHEHNMSTIIPNLVKTNEEQRRYIEELKQAEKKLKAFDVIKKELMLEVKEDNGLYRLITYQSDNHLIKIEQYDLLKGVLL